MPLAGSRKYKEVDLNKDPIIQAFYDLINKILDRPYPRSNKNQEHNEFFSPGDSLEPKLIGLEEEAKRSWIDFHNVDR